MQVRELVSMATFKEHCLGDGASAAQQLCFIAFLPDVIDTGAAGRNGYISVLKALAENFIDRPYSYFWAQGATHGPLEQNFDVGGYGYPALVAFSPKRSVYIPPFRSSLLLLIKYPS
jgi:protein disulfide-isomerase A6